MLKEGEDRINNEVLRLALGKDNIEARPIWKPMHLQPIFEQYPFYGDGTSDRLFKIGLCLPSGSNLTEYEIRMVISKIKNCFTVTTVQ